MDVSDLRVMGRATQGVRLINIKGNDSIAAVTKVMKEEEAPEGEGEGTDDEAIEEADLATETEESTEE
jgi:DNA gyrase subunit A